MKWLVALLLCCALFSCADPLDRVSDVRSLRVLAVRADTVFARPGATVPLTMLVHDGSPSSGRPVTIVWLGTCLNPAGDLYYDCYPSLRATLAAWPPADLARGIVPSALEGRAGTGTSFSLHLPESAIAARPQPQGVVHPYGIAFAFFAACAGELRAVDSDPPIGCFGADGAPLGQADFEFGYFTVYAYDDLVNRNPGLAAVAFSPAASGAPCAAHADCASGEHCSAAGLCIPKVPSCDASPKDCPPYALSPAIDHTTLERAVTANLRDDDAPWEAVWVSYFATAGRFDEDVRMAHDPYSGWSAEVDGTWHASGVRGAEVRLWAVVRDSRNGVSWAFQDVFVE